MITWLMGAIFFRFLSLLTVFRSFRDSDWRHRHCLEPVIGYEFPERLDHTTLHTVFKSRRIGIAPSNPPLVM
jgi:hypothetical protein